MPVVVNRAGHELVVLQHPTMPIVRSSTVPAPVREGSSASFVLQVPSYFKFLLLTLFMLLIA